MPHKKLALRTKTRLSGQLSQGLYEWLHAVNGQERERLKKLHGLNGFALALTDMENLVVPIDHGIRSRRFTIVPGLVMSVRDIEDFAAEVCEVPA